MKQCITMLATLTAAVGLAATVQAQAPKPLNWNLAAGRPTIVAGHSVGFYVWHEGDEVYVCDTSESDKLQPFAGKITVTGGEIWNPEGIRLENDDRFHQASP